MAIEPNIALQVNNDVLPGPLDLLSRIDALRKLKNENLLFRMNTESAEAAGQIYQQNMRPDGTFDAAGFLNGIVNNPATAWRAGEYLQQMQAREKNQNEIDKGNLENERLRVNFFGDLVGGLEAFGDNVSRRDVADAVSKAIANFPQDSKMRATLLAQLKELPPDGPQLARWVKQQQLQTMVAKDRFELVNAPVQQVQQGNRTVLVQTNRITGETREVGSYVQGATPQQMNTPYEVKNSKGETIAVVPLASVMPTVDASGRPQTMPLPGVAGGGPLQPAPGDVALHTELQRDYGKHLENLNTEIRAGEMMAQEQTGMLELIKKANTGGMTERLTALAKLAQGFGVPQNLVDKFQGGLTGDRRGDLASAQAFSKLVLDYAMQRLKSVAPAGWQMPAMEMNASLTSGPNLDLDTRAIEMIFNLNNKLLNFKTKEREFMHEAVNVPNEQKRMVWSHVARQRGLVDSEPVEVGSTQRGAVPAWVNPADIRDEGKIYTVESPDGKTTVRVRKQKGKLEMAP